MGINTNKCICDHNIGDTGIPMVVIMFLFFFFYDYAYSFLVTV